jgi:hypothetical protein
LLADLIEGGKLEGPLATTESELVGVNRHLLLMKACERGKNWGLRKHFLLMLLLEGELVLEATLNPIVVDLLGLLAKEHLVLGKLHLIIAQIQINKPLVVIVLHGLVFSRIQWLVESLHCRRRDLLLSNRLGELNGRL